MNPTPEPEITPRPAFPELVAFACAVREDWNPADVAAALAHAHSVGMGWERSYVELVRLMVHPETHPRELVPDSRDVAAGQRLRRHPDDPTPEYEAAKAALLEED